VTRLPPDRSPVAPPRRRRRHAAAGLRVAVGIALALATMTAPVAATMYKWIDANGRVVYSDQPPPANVKSEVVKPPPPPENPRAAQDLEDQGIANKQREKKKADEAKTADKARQIAEKRREVCVNALGQLRALQQKDDLLFRYNEKGEKVYYNDEMRRDEFERQQQVARENCPGS
jgi:hypothetical protein